MLPDYNLAFSLLTTHDRSQLLQEQAKAGLKLMLS